MLILEKGAELEPPPPPPPPVAEIIDLGASATADANPDDEWGGFTTGKKKKGKKGKVRTFHAIALTCLLQRQSHATRNLSLHVIVNVKIAIPSPRIKMHKISRLVVSPANHSSANRMTTRTP